MKSTMPDAADLPYRPCVGVLVFNAAGLVWAGHRKAAPNSEEEGSGQLWQMPQGGIDEGEDPEMAALRELYEETGISSVRPLGSTAGWLTYDLPPHLLGKALKGRYRGQKQMWFAYRFEGEESEIRIDPPPDGHAAEFDAWEWKKLEDMPRLIVPFKRDLYQRLVAEFRHLVD